MGKSLESAIALLNGTIGDYLARTGNGLAIAMECIGPDGPVPIDRSSLSRAYPKATPRVVVLVHGLMCTEAVWRFPNGDDYVTRRTNARNQVHAVRVPAFPHDSA